MTQLKIHLQCKCVTFFFMRNTALLGCLNCIPFLIHIENAAVATVAPKQKKQTGGSKCMSLLEPTEAETRGEDLALGWILLKCSICIAVICTR